MGLSAGISIFSILSSAILGTRNARTQAKATENAARIQAQSAKSLIGSLPAAPTGPTAAEIEAQKQAQVAEEAKAAAEKRTSDLEASIKADTLAAETRKRSLIGLAATVKTSARGLTGAAPTEKKTLLGQGGAF